MNEPLQSLARHVEDDPFFLASLLKLYAHGERLDDAGLAAAIGCRPEDLVMIRLCRAPRPDAAGFREDVSRVAERFGADRQKLAAVVRRSLVIRKMSMSKMSMSKSPQEGSLLAARDHDEEKPPEES
jgi:hypothetical protein